MRGHITLAYYNSGVQQNTYTNVTNIQKHKNRSLK